MTLRFAVDAINQAHELGTVEELYFEGGEPFLFYPILLSAARLAAERGMKTGLVTNSYFATSVEDAIVYLEPFAGLPGFSISLSEDTFHGSEEGDSETSRVREAAGRLGIPCGIITIEEPCGLPAEHDKGSPILGGGVRFRGRAVDTIAGDPDLPRRPWDELTECPDEDWNNIKRLHLDGYGNLFACQGIVVGNLSRQTLREVVDSFDPEKHPIIGPLMRGGPAELVRRFRLDLQGEYLDECHLCYLARRETRMKFPQLLRPPLVYGVEV